MNANIHTAEVLPPRALLFLGIVALHVVFAWFLTSGLMSTTIKLLLPTRPVEAFPIEMPKPAPEKVTIDEPQLVNRIYVPTPDTPDIPVIEEPVFTDTVAEPVDPRPITETPPATVAEPPIRLIGRNVLPNSEDYYPAVERRLSREGSAVVQACVNENGKLLDGAPTLESSSGSGALDNAALRLARDGKYARSLRGDRPVPNCHRFRVTFSMR